MSDAMSNEELFYLQSLEQRRADREQFPPRGHPDSDPLTAVGKREEPDPADLLRNALNAAKAIQADMDAMGVGRPKAPTPSCAGCGLAVDDDPHLIKVWPTIDVREYWHPVCYVRQHMGLLGGDV